MSYPKKLEMRNMHAYKYTNTYIHTRFNAYLSAFECSECHRIAGKFSEECRFWVHVHQGKSPSWLEQSVRFVKYGSGCRGGQLVTYQTHRDKINILTTYKAHVLSSSLVESDRFLSLSHVFSEIHLKLRNSKHVGTQVTPNDFGMGKGIETFYSAQTSAAADVNNDRGHKARGTKNRQHVLMKVISKYSIAVPI